MKLFRLENYEAVLNSEEILLIPEFKALFSLNYNKKKGDVDGRKRIRAYKELVYLYLVKDYKSEFSNYSNEERHKEALISAELPKNYKISKELQAAISKYDKLQQTLSYKALSSVRNTLLTSMEMAETLELLMQDELKKIKQTIADGEESYLKDINELLNLIKNSGAIAASLPKTILTLEGLEDKVKAEKQNEDGKIRGDQEEGWMD